MTKKELRELGKNWRMALGAEQRKILDDEIRNALQGYLHGCKHVAIFLPILKFNEIDLTPLLKVPSFEWYAPKSFFSERRMEFIPLREGVEIEVSANGIPEPVGDNYVNPEILDAIIVPMLMSDKQGYRVGYGMGFYDNFLKRCRTDCKRIGVNYFAPVEKISDIDSHDEPLHFCVYPKDRILNCKKNT
jgi:5-formyltetrahydrofolate cyclo-ligase